jgi:hypothetical protein
MSSSDINEQRLNNGFTSFLKTHHIQNNEDKNFKLAVSPKETSPARGNKANKLIHLTEKENSYNNQSRIEHFSPISNKKLWKHCS